MDIRKPTKPTTQTETKQQKQEEKTENKFKTGVVSTADAKLIIPPAIQLKLTAIGAKYGLPFELSNIGLDGKMAENVKAIRKVADMVTGDSKLLPEMMKQIRRLMKAEIKLAQFHKLVVKASIQHQEKIDKQTADIFLAMAGYQSKSAKTEYRTNVRNQLKEKRTQAYTKHYEESVYGSESSIIDAEYELLESNRKILTGTKLERLTLDNERKQKMVEYVQSAYQN